MMSRVAAERPETAFRRACPVAGSIRDSQRFRSYFALSIARSERIAGAHLVRLIEEDARQLPDLRRTECWADHAPLRAVRRTFGDEQSFTKRMREQPAYERGLDERFRV
jgi:hypothetical protein